MVLRKLAKRAKLLVGIGLAGLVMAGAGKVDKASAQECAEAFAAESGRANVQAYEHSPGFAADNGNLLRIGAYNDICNWTNGSAANSKGPRVDRVGAYIELGHGLSKDCTAYIKVGAENPVFNEGVSNPDDPSHTFDISPNHFIPMVGIGVRIKKESQDKRFALVGEAEISGVSEFSNYLNRGVNGSEVLVDSSTYIRGSLLGKIDPNFFDNVSFLKNIKLVGGVDLSSSYVHGRILDYNGTDMAYREFYPRNKTCFRPVVGFEYRDSFNCTSKLGNGGASINLSFSKRF